MDRNLTQVMADVRRCWPKPYFAAQPYISALSTLSSVDERFGLDSGRELVERLLSNAGTWRGADARRLKDELRQLLKRPRQSAALAALASGGAVGGVASGLAGDGMPKRVPRYAADFHRLVHSVQRHLEDALAINDGVLHRVETSVDLFEVYLSAFPAEDRQYHNCNCCRSFIQRYGGLVTVGRDGVVYPALWTSLDTKLPVEYARASRDLAHAVAGGKVVEQFLWSDVEWGTKEQGGFDHLWARPGLKHRWTRLDMSAGQAMAAKREDRRHLQRALGDLTLEDVTKAHSMLTMGGLQRGDKLAPMAQFLIDAHRAVHGRDRRSESYNRLLWAQVSRAAAGWCTPRSSALGALIDDLRTMSVDAARRRHDERMDPLKYQRPQAPASAGNVAQAERLFESMGLAPALERRVARADELVFLWRPAERRREVKGVFGHLLGGVRDTAERELNSTRPTVVTFAKFRRDVLPHALALEAQVPRSGAFCCFTTQAVPGAPPILRWDSMECRNPFAWYVYASGSPASVWGLRPGAWVSVVAASLTPDFWGSTEVGAGDSALLVLEGARDTRAPGLCLFPETLRAELHPVRRTIEMHSQSRQLAHLPKDVQAAAGLRVGDGMPVVLRVRTATGVFAYHVDRWE